MSITIASINLIAQRLQYTISEDESETLKRRTSVLPVSYKELVLTKDGYEVRHQDKGVYSEFVIVKDNKVLGFITLVPNLDYACIKASFLDRPFRGRGIGIIMYEAAIKKHKRVMSDSTLSRHAVGVWHSLQKGGYKVKLMNTVSQQDVKFRWGSDGVPRVDGESIEKLSSKFVFHT